MLFIKKCSLNNFIIFKIKSYPKIKRRFKNKLYNKTLCIIFLLLFKTSMRLRKRKTKVKVKEINVQYLYSKNKKIHSLIQIKQYTNMTKVK